MRLPAGLRDYFSDDVGECLIDEPEAFQKAQEYMQRFMPPDAQRKLKLYQDPVPLFTRYQIESQIESAYAHKVTLPSGGSLVIDHTEALVSIDINSARSTRGGDIEATARNTNLEAAEEIARQLRLRDIGGLIVIDFIDMESTANQRAVEDMLRDSVKMDRARIQLGRLSRFGLLELSRQRLRPALSETTHINCPRCSGMGTIRSVESMSLALLRLIGEEARKERTGRVITQVPVDVATYLMNEKREQLQQIETRDKVSLVIVPNPHMQTPAYTLRRVRDDEKELPENTTVSYQLADQPSVDDSNIGNRDKKPPGDVPLVPSLLSASAAPVIPMPVPAAAPAAVQTAHVGVLVRLWRWLFGNSAGRAAAASPAPTHTQRDRPPHRDARPDRYRSGGDRDRNRDRSRDVRRDPPRDAQRDGQRDPRRDGRPRGDFGARREGSGQRNEVQGPRQDQSSRPDQAPRGDLAPRADQAPRPDQPPRADQPRGNDPERSSSERGERGGRSRRRRGRGRREGGENTANGAGANPALGAAPGAPSSPAPNEARGGDNNASPPSAAPSFEPPAPPFESVRSSEPARSFEPTHAEPSPAYEPPRERPVASAPAEPAPFREPAPAPSRADETASSKGNENKYVVWSSTPSDVQRSGPDER